MWSNQKLIVKLHYTTHYEVSNGDYREGAAFHILRGTRSHVEMKTHENSLSPWVAISKGQCSLFSLLKTLWATFLPVSISKRFPWLSFNFSLMPHFQSTNLWLTEPVVIFTLDHWQPRLPPFFHRCEVKEKGVLEA